MNQKRAEAHLDFETYSEADIRSFGHYRYASDPSTEILLMAFRFASEEQVHLFVPARYETSELSSTPGALEALSSWLQDNPKGVIYAHNAYFEEAIVRYCWDRDPQLAKFAAPRPNQWRCTKVMAMRAALPNSLEKIGRELGLEEQKDTRGAALIKKFSCPRKPTQANPKTRIMPWDEPEEFRRFGEYCIQDVVTEQKVHTALAPMDLTGSVEKAYVADLHMNRQGLPINVPALKQAIQMLQSVEREKTSEFWGITGYMPSQTQKVQAWLNERGYPHKNLQAETMSIALSDTDWAVDEQTVEALRLRAEITFAATKKLQKMLDCDCGDGYLRGMFQFVGAFRTGRWSAKVVQPQNFRRPTIEDPDLAYELIQSGATAEEVDMIHGNPLETVASCIRNFIQPHNGEMLNADYAQIEARLVCWLAGQEDALNDYRSGADRYIKLASFAFDIPEKNVSKGGIERFIGKQAILGCGFGMGVDNFQATCAKYGKEVDYDICETAVNTFRETHPKVVKLWQKCETAAKRAIFDPGKWHPAGNKLHFATMKLKSCGIKFLMLRLPSGRINYYPRPRIEKVAKWGRTIDQIAYYAPLPGKQNKWGWIHTYGGKLVENATQGTAACFMQNGFWRAVARGFPVVGLIHDEVLSLENENLNDAEQEKAFCDALTHLPKWGQDVPLEVEFQRTPYYKK